MTVHFQLMYAKAHYGNADYCLARAFAVKPSRRQQRREGLTAQRARAEGGYAAVDNFRSFCSLHILTKRAKTAIDDRPGVVAQISVGNLKGHIYKRQRGPPLRAPNYACNEIETYGPAATLTPTNSPPTSIGRSKSTFRALRGTR